MLPIKARRQLKIRIVFIIFAVTMVQNRNSISKKSYRIKVIRKVKLIYVNILYRCEYEYLKRINTSFNVVSDWTPLMMREVSLLYLKVTLTVFYTILYVKSQYIENWYNFCFHYHIWSNIKCLIKYQMLNQISNIKI